MQPDFFITADMDAAATLTRGMPRDQALGLRLMALARAAAGMHLGQVALGSPSAQSELTAQESVDRPRLLRSQAKGLVRLAREHAEEHGQDARATESA